MPELPEQLEIELTKRVGLLAACFPHVAVGEQTIMAYVRALAHTPLDVLDAVIEQAAAECRFFPTLAELRDIELRLSSPSGLRPCAAEAWGQVRAAIGSVGFYGKPTFGDDLVARAVEYIGWRALCTSENAEADRAHFMRIYEQIVTREVEAARLMPRARELRALTAESSRRLRLVPGSSEHAA